MNALQVAVLRAKWVKLEVPVDLDPALPKIEPREIIQPHVVIQRVVAQYYGVTRSDILSPSRKMKYVKPRWIALLLCRERLPGKCGTLIRLGRIFGGRDHTTIVNGLKKIDGMMERDPALKQQVAEIREMISNG